ncbi:aminoglycoside phosphotransferase [Nonomuraea sp. KC401]|uniref:phosphotransferase family protein n=1 Tax=unclassified Nonomuraea TaxID=2593643 RepID=UPI0010FD8588|nr:MULTISPECIES: phosphotransferase [unclassified Nonomuraea]NBE98297.1 phosphotransferase [Nonomuraea sp. K271]TLF56186.1 aminoglycoside phosphotransferase [Nonomuraea sp. KC401]
MTYSPVPRLDITRYLERLPVPLTYDGPCHGGEVGAAYVRWPDGHRSVLTRGPDVSELPAVARAAGVPAPAYELVHPPVVVQELLPGGPARVPTAETVRSMIEINRRCRGVLAGRTDLPGLPLYLREDGPGFCLHGPLRAYDGRTRRLLGEVEEIGRAFPDVLQGDDLVHVDFHPENVLVDARGTVTGVIDWDGAARGDGDFDLVTLRFDLAGRAPHLLPGVPDTLTPVCWAHMALRLVDWAIRHHSASDVTHWLDLAHRLRPR